MKDWTSFRADFPLLNDLTFLGSASTGPLSRATIAAMEQEMREAGKIRDVDWRAMTRTRAAELIRADAESIVLTPSTSAGINLLAAGLTWRPSENVVIKESDHPTVVYPWIHQASRRGFEVRRVRGSGRQVTVEELARAIDRNTRVVAVSHVEFGTGYRNDIVRLADAAHRAGALLLVDAIQSLGTLPMDVIDCGIDCLAAGGFKWMCGPRGTGFAYLAPAVMEALTPPTMTSFNLSPAEDLRATALLRAGVTSEIDAVPFASGWRRFEPRGVSPVLLAGFEASLAQLTAVGIEAIAARIDELRSYLVEEALRREVPVLSSLESQHRSAIVTVGVPANLAEPSQVDVLNARLLAEQIVAHPRAGGLRFGVHAFNNEEDVDRAVEFAASLWREHRNSK